MSNICYKNIYKNVPFNFFFNSLSVSFLSSPNFKKKSRLNKETNLHLIYLLSQAIPSLSLSKCFAYPGSPFFIFL